MPVDLREEVHAIGEARDVMLRQEAPSESLRLAESSLQITREPYENSQVI